MVIKGQFLERPTLIPVGEGLVLEGVSHRGERRPGLLVLPPPPIEGGGMDHVVGAELAFAVSRAGFPTLRFNYRGVGGSQGARSRRPQDWLDDAREALLLARDNAGGRPVVVASQGASDVVALRLAEAGGVAGLALINPTVVRPEELAAAGATPLLVVVGQLDDARDRAAWSGALAELGGDLQVIPGASRGFERNLPLVGKVVAALVDRAGLHAS